MKQALEYFRTPERKLFLVSLLVVLLLVLILRLSSSQFRIIGYMQYAVLASALFGISLGLKGRPADSAGRNTDSCLISFLLLMVLFAACRFTQLGSLGLIADVNTYFGSLLYLNSESAHELIASLAVIGLLHLTLRCFLYMGKAASALLFELPPLSAYLIVLTAGLAGIAVSSAFMALCLSPALWAGAILIGALAIGKMSKRQLALGISAASLTVALSLPQPLDNPAGGFPSSHIWGSNYEIQTVPLMEGTSNFGFALLTNGSLNQVAFDPAIADQTWHRLQKTYESLDLRDAAPGFYQIPYKVCPHPNRVLILGAGTGNDLAECLAHGASSVDAVEIDSAILKLGLAHPAKPYDNPKVRTHCQDARTFLMTHPGKYDLIIIGQLDSQTATSALSLIRPSDFVYTVESFKLLRDHLSEEGYLAVASGNYRRWFLMRLALNLSAAFHIVDGGVLTTSGQYLFTSKHHARDLQKALSTSKGVYLSPDTIKLNELCVDSIETSDDYPFTFVRTRTVPHPYLWCLYLLLAVVLMNYQFSLGRNASADNPPLQGAPQRQTIVSVCLGLALMLTLIWTVTSSTRIFGSNSEVVGWTLICIWLLGLITGMGTKRYTSWRHLDWVTAAAFLLAFFSMEYLDHVSWPGRALSAVLILFPPMLVCMRLSYTLKDGARPAPFAHLIGGAAAGLLLTNLSLMLGIPCLLALALLSLLLSKVASGRQYDKPETAQHPEYDAGTVA